ncbi:MAG: outer membrane protein assembly factor BamE [Proteobacteria bacterium]|nr:outer membrane protein assembly factor BamE [Pseudomonadota bacterium]
MKSMRGISGITRRKALMWLGVGLSASAVSGCTSEKIIRGYRPKPGAFSQISEGMSKTEVESALGSPSTKASINYNGDSYYYISSIAEARAFLKPAEVSREIIAVRFDQQDRVTSVAQYGLEDGRVFNINDRKTPVIGQELNILQELFAGAQKGGPGTSILGRRLGQ